MTKGELDGIKLYQEVACGNPEAEMFLYHWTVFAHGIDDIIDDYRDGKPIDAEQFIGVMAQSCIAYTLPFYQHNSARLQPVVMAVTNMYADSVKWERSDSPKLRAIADGIRSCGNELLCAVALICGGYSHMRRISSVLRERSYDKQHDDNGNPI